MRFIDEAIIRVAGGHGGPGCVSFRRETFAPRGGPDGGDGGDGGEIAFVATHQLGTLQDFRFKRVYQAPAGMHGSGANKAGRDGEDIEIPVPVGTVIRDAATNELLIDFVSDGQKWVACKGGRGGKGNAHFVSSTHQAPKFAQPGEDGEARELKLELKLLADVGIIGFPNAGKSTLISRISHARPKIADYPFTTLTPNLGVVQMPDLRTFVVADIPGLVEGAHRGLGLGHKFLKHIERTGLFLHVLDGTKLLEDATKPDSDLQSTIDHLIERYQIIRRELELFNEKLLHKPEIIVLNKVDLLESDPELVERARLTLRQRITSIRGSHPLGEEPYVISAVSGKGIQELLFVIQKEVEEHRSGAARRNAEVKLPDDEDIRT
ncbi:MAG: GTPase ObgE [Oligoflexia bacterium]|nr:GTPase ObgE [Oligoflexia bacterium]